MIEQLDDEWSFVGFEEVMIFKDFDFHVMPCQMDDQWPRSCV